MLRPLIAASALLATAVPASAASYSANLASPVSGRFIARDIVWNCGPAACQGATDNSRPVVLCQSLARRAGRVESFLSDGRALDAAALAKCNAAAKTAKADALASK